MASGSVHSFFQYQSFFISVEQGSLMPSGDEIERDSEIEREVAQPSNGPTSPFNPQRTFELAWLELRMCWQSIDRTRLDEKKKQAIETLIQHYQAVKTADRPRHEFNAVLLRLQEEHALRLRELSRDERRSRKFQNAVIQIVRDNNAARLQYCRDRAEETPPMIAEWQGLIDSLFSDATVEPIAE